MLFATAKLNASRYITGNGWSNSGEGYEESRKSSLCCRNKPVLLFNKEQRNKEQRVSLKKASKLNYFLMNVTSQE
jgi:hypothetical protein